MRINCVLAAASLAFLLSGCSAGIIETNGTGTEVAMMDAASPP